ncbi:30S ribosomal protein S6 [Candidatus Wolfebacteria bacterium]|nr:30S ribosomal protein S6 [Candidatus Wolfebacteria bacterium]
MEKENKKYEIGFLASSEEARNSIIEALKKYKAEIFNEGDFKKIKLAYPVKKQISAFFGYIQFSANPSIIAGLKDSLKLNSQVLRFIVVLIDVKIVLTKQKADQVFEKPEFKKVEIKKPKPQPILSNEDLEKKLEEMLK